jgi:hypothetical protein
LFFLCLQGGKKLSTQRVVLRTEFLDQACHDLSVAQFAETTEKAAGDFAHRWPRGVGINLFHNCGKRTAAAKSDAEIMDSVGIVRRRQALQFFENAIHPVGKAAVRSSHVSGSCNRERRREKAH